MNSTVLKARVKTTVLSWAAFGWSKLGRPRSALAHSRFADEFLVGSVRALGRSEAAAPAERPLKIVFFTVLGSHSFMTGTDVALGRALRARGHEVELVICDAVLPACENKSIDNRDRWDDVCGKCALRGEAMLRASGLNYSRLGELAGAPASDIDAELAEIDLSHAVESSLYKYFRVGRLSETPEMHEATERITAASRLTARAALALVRGRPDRVIMSHGVYSSWAPALAVFNRAKVPVAVYNKGKRKNTAVMNWVDGPMDWDVSEEWERVRRQPLTPEQTARIGAYLESRVSQKSDAMVYNFGDVETPDSLMQRLGLDPAKPVFVLFTNLLWDAASAQKEIAFPNSVDWVMETIEWFAGHPEKQLVVKIHPAEALVGTNQPFAGEIRKQFPVLPGNVRVIEPSEVINSWSIPAIATAGLVHTSTPGMELPLEGVPCILVSAVHYRGKGFTIDVRTKAEYFRAIETWDSSAVDKAQMRELALRYAYLLFERYHLNWGFLREAGYGRYYAVDASDDSELLANETVALLCDAIETQRSFLTPCE